jgi:hypothetical protein
VKLRQPLAANASPLNQPKLSSITACGAAVKTLWRQSWSLSRYCASSCSSDSGNDGMFARSTRPTCRSTSLGSVLWSNLPSPGTFRFSMRDAVALLTELSVQVPLTSA